MDLKQLNLKEINYLQELFGFDKNGSNFVVKNNVGSKKIFDAFIFLRKEIWSNENIKATIDQVSQSGSNKIVYSPPSYLSPIDDFLGKVGIMDHQILVLDPLSEFVSMDPNHKDSWYKDPASYLPYLFESSLLLFSIADWIEADLVRLVPHIQLWDYKGWVELADLNGEILDSKKLESTLQFERYSKVAEFEVTIKFFSEFLRFKQSNYSSADVKEYMNISEEEAIKMAKQLQSIPKDKRDKIAIQIAAEQSKLDQNDPVYLDYLNRFPKHQIFDAENYLDISKLTDTLIISRGLTLTHGLHIGDRLGAVIATDDLVQKESFKLYTDAVSLSPEYAIQQELVKSKVDLNMPFLKGLKPDFIVKQKVDGNTTALKHYLDKEWQSIKGSQTPKGYLNALQQFENSIKSEYKGINADLKSAVQQALLTSAGGVAVSAKVFMSNIVEHDFWYAAAMIIPTLFGGILTGVKGYQHIQTKLKKNPLFIFIKRG